MSIHLAGCVSIQDQKILLLHRQKRGWYELPGGKVELYETPQNTAIRELHEELCVSVHIVRKLDEAIFTNFHYH